MYTDNDEEFAEELANVFEPENLVYSYKGDLDHLYNSEEKAELDSILNSWGFGALIPLFYYERIDLEAFKLLSKELIMDLLKQYGLGIRLKFLKSFNTWINQNDSIKENISSVSTVVLHSDLSQSSNNVDQNTFLNFMNNTSEGKRFGMAHPQNEILSMNDKRDLCKILCAHLLLDGMFIGTKEAKVLADSISQYFIKENPNVYFEGDSGLLYSKAKNMINSLRQKSVIPGPAKRKKPNSLHENINQDKMFGSEEINSDDFVKSNPFDVSDLLISHWKNSINLRHYNLKKLDQNSKIQDIIELYKTYQRTDGYYFLDIDFKASFTSENYDNKWNFLNKALISILRKENKNAEIKAVLEKYDSYGNSAKILALIYGTHGYLYSGTSTNRTAQNKRPRETIKQSFSNIFPLIENEALVSNFVSNFQEDAKKNRDTVQPYIICFGTNIQMVMDNFLLIFDQYRYKFNSMAKAIEILLKIYMLFDLKFPKSNKNILEFLTGFLFDQKYQFSTKTKALIDAVNSFEYECEEIVIV